MRICCSPMCLHVHVYCSASRMESHGLPGKIHISAASYHRITSKGKYATKERGSIQVKGKGLMQVRARPLAHAALGW